MLDGGLQQVVETESLRNVDGSASAALKQLPSVLAAPDPELLGAIIVFAALQHLRVPANKQMISMVYEAGANDGDGDIFRQCGTSNRKR